MEYLKVTGEFLLRPYEAFNMYKGKYLSLSMILGILLASPLLITMIWFMDYSGKALALILAVAVANVLASVTFLHLTSLMFGGSGKWRDLLSLYGFTTLPNLLMTVVTVATFVGGLTSFRDPALPGLFTPLGRGVIAYFFFDLAMRLAAHIYTGLAVNSVYKLKWAQVVGCLLISAIGGSFVSGLFSGGVVPFRSLSWQVMPLMLEGVEEVQVDFNANNTVAVKKPELVPGELVLVTPKSPVFLRTPEAGNVRFFGDVLAELVGVPGDRVALQSGKLIVNGVVKHEAAKPLPHLSLDEVVLGPGQYFIYFNSPTLLGTETNPELFRINGEEVLSAVSHRTLSFLRWLTR